MNNDSNIRIEVNNKIKNITDAKGIYDLFRFLKYPEEVIFDETYRRKKETFDFRKEDFERIDEIYSILSFEEHLHIFLIKACSVSTSFIRSVTNTFSKQFLNFCLIFTINYSEIVFVLPEKEIISPGIHKLIITKLHVDLENIYYTDTQILSGLIYEGEENWREIWRKWKEAFNVEKVTKQFFKDYKEIFFYLRKEIETQNISIKESHEFTLQFLNRIMFIYFIAKKKWLSYPKFMNWYWTEYRKQKKFGSNEFFQIWLKQLFFKALNNRALEIEDLPETVQRELEKFPFLNGGLFTENDVDQLDISITDEMFKQIYAFYENYNFTIKEDMPLDYEVAVDPQMIGFVYESLANVAEEIYDRTDLGIFYTPRDEVDFMCRRSLAEYLSNHLSSEYKPYIYQLLFDPPESSTKAEKYLSDMNLWNELEFLLNELSIIDPACGSGAFLVGMVYVLTELYKIIFKYLNSSIHEGSIKLRIIQRSMYGVDIMPWAIKAAEIRLWLLLIVDTKIPKEELKRKELLPNLDLNLRVGNSLIQDIGGVNLSFRTYIAEGKLKRKLEDLKQEKRNYFLNSLTARYKSFEEFRNAEIELFKEIIESRKIFLNSKIKKQKEILRKRGKQVTLINNLNKKDNSSTRSNDRKRSEIEEIIQLYKQEIENLDQIKEKISLPEKKPFVWEIDYAEIFSDKKGFDIVIGNPPYIRHQNISPHDMEKQDVTLADKRAYKMKLVESVKSIYPFFKKLSLKNDYYIYFYFHGLNLLNKKGVFCFITSNSWLDSDYGKDLQEFLLRYVPIHAIFDYQKRSFEHADVNTVIVILGVPQIQSGEFLGFLKSDKRKEINAINNNAKFVMNYKTFKEVISSSTLELIENAKVKKKGASLEVILSNTILKDDLRIVPIRQIDLLEMGWKYSSTPKDGKTVKGRYCNGYWGARYLRSPKIIFDIISKNKGLISELKNFCYISTYLNTGGADDYFFVKGQEKDSEFIFSKDSEKFKVNKIFFKHLIDSPRELNTIQISSNKLNNYILSIPNTIQKSELQSKEIWKYIEWGEKQGFNRKSGRKQKRNWWVLPSQAYEGSTIIVPCRIGERHAIFWNPQKIISHRYYRIKPKPGVNEENLIKTLNSTFTFISLELFRNPTLGGGVLDIGKPSLENIYVIDPALFSDFKDTSFPLKKISSIFTECGIDPTKPIRNQPPHPLPIREKIDCYIFEKLNLSETEKNEIYWSVCELANQRLEKAKSLRKKR